MMVIDFVHPILQLISTLKKRYKHEAKQKKSINKKTSAMFEGERDEKIETNKEEDNYIKDVAPGVPDVPTDGYEDEQICWKSSDEDDNEEVSISKDDDDDADDHDDDDQEYNGQDDEDEEDKKEEGSDLRVQTPSHYESTDDEESDEETQGANVEGKEMDEE
ncbi:hypothetical protein Tco_0233820 [Tanacetum coccineum]